MSYLPDSIGGPVGWAYKHEYEIDEDPDVGHLGPERYVQGSMTTKLFFRGLMRIMYSMPLPDLDPVTPEEMMVTLDESRPNVYDPRSPFRDFSSSYRGVELTHHNRYGWSGTTWININTIGKRLIEEDVCGKLDELIRNKQFDLYFLWQVGRPGLGRPPEIKVFRCARARLAAGIEPEHFSVTKEDATATMSFLFAEAVAEHFEDVPIIHSGKEA